MPLYYKINVLDELNKAGFKTTDIRKNRLLSESTLQAIRDNKGIGWKNIETICSLLKCQPGDLIGYVD